MLQVFASIIVDFASRCMPDGPSFCLHFHFNKVVIDPGRGANLVGIPICPRSDS